MAQSVRKHIDQDQLDRLFTAALEAAIARIEKDRHFFPLLFELRRGGEIQAVAVLEKDSVDGERDVLERFNRILQPRAAQGTIDAVALAVHRSDHRAIELRMRARNYAANIFAPYRLERKGLIRASRKLVLGDFAAEPARNEIFGD